MQVDWVEVLPEGLDVHEVERAVLRLIGVESSKAEFSSLDICTAIIESISRMGYRLEKLSPDMLRKLDDWVLLAWNLQDENLTEGLAGLVVNWPLLSSRKLLFSSRDNKELCPKVKTILEQALADITAEAELDCKKITS